MTVAVTVAPVPGGDAVLLIVHHTPSPALQEMFEAAVSGGHRSSRKDREECWELGALLAAEIAG